MNNTSVESFLRDGCGRCDRYLTPLCKVHTWPTLLRALREVLRESGLEETMKWGSPCYMAEGRNVVMLGVRVDSCVLGFFQGAALGNADGLLEPAGPNSRYGRLVVFRTVDEVEERRERLLRLLAEAEAFSRSGGKVEVEPGMEPMPEALQALLSSDPALRDAFDALTPGRQRSHILHVSGAKQEATRVQRAAKCAPRILAGKGFNER